MSMSSVHYITIAAAFFTAAAFAFFVTPAVKIFAFKIGAVDIPLDERRMHKEPTARLGGLAIYLGFLVSTAFFAITTKFLNMQPPIIGIIIGASIIIALGVADDIMDLGPRVKLLIQIIAAAIPVFCGVRIDVLTNLNISYINHDLLSIPLTIIWIVGITNAVNLIDGIDGLAAGISTISAVTVLIIMILIGNLEMALITAALAGACTGFIPFNFNPARIFMGDTGATFLGFIMAVVSVQGLFKSYLIVSFAVPFLVLGLPIFDTLYAIFRRVSEGRSPMSPDRMHIHHRLIDMGLSQNLTVAVLLIVSVSFSLCAIVMTSMSRGKAIVFAIITFAVVISLIWYISSRNIAKKENGDKTLQESNDEQN